MSSKKKGSKAENKNKDVAKPPPKEEEEEKKTEEVKSPPTPPPTTSISEAVVLNDQKVTAEEAKNEGNIHFKQNKYAQALESYTLAISLNPSEPVYFSNRAFTHFKLENYGLAIADATSAINLNKSFVKGYYRRGAAFFALGRYRDAVNDFKTATQLAPKDKDAAMKLAECSKSMRAAAFLKAIENEATKPPSETLDLTTIEVDKSYEGPHLPKPITLEFIVAMMEHFKKQKTIHRKYVYEIILGAMAVMKKLPNLVDITVPEGKSITVCGDVHGQYYDVLNIFKLNGMPSESNPYLFNGDFVDRGSFSLEIIVTFFALKMLYPNHFHLTRGNHETRTMNQIYGFQGEVSHKVDSRCFELFNECFCYLPLGCVLNKRVLVVHGGLFAKDGVTLADIQKIDRNCQPPDSGIMCEIMWSDPMPQNGRAPSKRGVALSFGPDVTARFLKENNLDLIVRSHEVKEEGYEVEANDKLITIFSAPNYCDQMNNKGAILKFYCDSSDKPLRWEATKFTAVEHPAVAPMAYASPMHRMG
jgi:serine/threonine-protein phosphatase 5